MCVCLTPTGALHHGCAQTAVRAATKPANNPAITAPNSAQIARRRPLHQVTPSASAPSNPCSLKQAQAQAQHICCPQHTPAPAHAAACHNLLTTNNTLVAAPCIEILSKIPNLTPSCSPLLGHHTLRKPSPQSKPRTPAHTASADSGAAATALPHAQP